MRALLVGLVAFGCGSAKDKEAPKEIEPAVVVNAALEFVPEVPGHGFEPISSADATTIIASASAIVVEGKSIVALHDGAVEASQLQDRKIPRLTTFVTALDAESKARNAPPPSQYLLALDRKHSFQLLVQIISSVKATGAKQFGIVARKGKEYLQLPLALPDHTATGVVPQVAPASTDAPSNARASTSITEKSAAPETTLTPDAIAAKVQSAYAAGIKRCHKRAVEVATTEPLEVAFTVGPQGRVTSPVVKAASQAIGDCIAQQITMWRFPIPKDTDGEPASTTAKLSLSVTIEPSVPLEYAAPEPVMQPVPSPETQPLGLAIAITKTDVVVWSISGLEGTLAQPRHRFLLADAAAQLPVALTDIVKRRWAGRKRTDADRDILVMADAPTTLETLAPLLGAVRAAPDGTELFPRILLSTGFE